MSEKKAVEKLKSQSYEVNFIADVHLLKILGEHLIGSEKVGILELIKNAYDANATSCDVYIEQVPGLPDAAIEDPKNAELPGPVITIIDNGNGMNRKTIEDGWLRPATRIKTSVKDRLNKGRKEADRRGTQAEYNSLVKALKREYGGRLPLGEKGVGRFATNRLGRYLILTTKTKDDPIEWSLSIDWDEFDAGDDSPRDLNTVKLKLISQEPSRDYGSTNSGTKLLIYGGRVGYDWDDKKLLDIGHAIALLQSPSKSSPDTNFKVKFIAPQLSVDIEIPTETAPAPFECIAIVDQEGMADIEIRLNPPESLKKPLPAEVWSENLDLRQFVPDDNKKYWLSSDGQSKLRSPACGPFTLDIKAWIRTQEWIDLPNWRELTYFLDEFGGIGLFRDGLSILPAQISSKDDWLRLSRRHIKRGVNISYYMMSGSLDLIQEKTLGLIDRTSREGMLETQAFEDLRELVRPIIFILEDRLKDTRKRYNLLKKGERISSSELNKRARVASQLVNRISKNYDFSTDSIGLIEILGDTAKPEKIVAEISNTINELRGEINDLRNQSDALIEAAGYGVAIAVAIHEIEKVTSNIFFRIDKLGKKSTKFDEESYKQITQIRDSSRSLLNELKRLAPLRVTRLERKRVFSVRDSILAASGAFRASLNDLGITFHQPIKSNDFEIYGSFGACSQVFANLFDNALYWLRNDPNESQRIIVQINPDNKRVIVADNGPGISEKMRPNLFELFFSLKNPPSGLGLYICKYYMRQMRGNIRESLDSERISGFDGAHFTLIFPRDEKKS